MVEEDSGQEFYYSRSKAAVWQKDTNKSDTLNEGTTKVSQKQLRAMDDVLGSLRWAPSFTKVEKKAIGKGQYVVNNSMLKMLSEAETSMGRW